MLVAGRSGFVAERPMLRCERTQVRISPRTVVFIVTVTAICSLVHGLRTYCSALHPSGELNRVPASAGIRGRNVTSAGWQVTMCYPI